jgi:mannitol 2-dehydrogenase
MGMDRIDSSPVRGADAGTPAVPLRRANLGRLPAHVEVPRYDRGALRPAVVHISVGSFHRAHQALYFDDLAQAGISDRWGLTGVGLHRPQMRDVLSAQDGLYSVVSRGGGPERIRVVGAIGRYLFAPEEGGEVLAALAAPDTRLVTLTITGDGYHPPSEAEPEHREGSAPALVVEALRRRRLAGVAPFTVLSCDNLAENGRIARAALVEWADRRDPDLATWIEANVAFPSSMVDRITPRTTPAERDRIARVHGVDDRWPVVAEPFRQWVIEDSFCNERPPLQEVGAQFVDDVRPHSLLKTRLLNAGHCALGHLGTLVGHRRSDEAMADPLLAGFLPAMMDEVTPLLPGAAGVDLASYRCTVLARFANPALGDSLARLCRSSSSKVPEHVVPSLAAARAAGLPHALLTVVVAGWIRYLREGGGRVPLDDPLAAELPRLVAGPGTPALLAQSRFFGDLAGDADFAAELAMADANFEALGARGAIAAALAGQLPLTADGSAASSRIAS